MAYIIFLALCFIYSVQSAVVINIYEGADKAIHSLEECTAEVCAQLCRDFGFFGGVCKGNTCICDGFQKKGFCNSAACTSWCESMHIEGGKCVAGICDCVSPIVTKTSHKSREEFQAIDSCNPTACDQLCRRLGFPGGACVGDKCDCDNFQPYKEFLRRLQNIQQCNTAQCNDMCHRLNYIGGLCLNDSCSCY